MMNQDNSHVSPALDCTQVGDLLSARLDDALTAEEGAALDAHLAACPVCAAEAERLRCLRSEIANAAYTPPAGLRAGVLAAVRREKRMRLIRRITSIGAVGIAAMFCIVIGIGVGRGGQAADFSPMAGNRALEADDYLQTDAEAEKVADAPECAPAEIAAPVVMAVRLPDEARSLPKADVSPQYAVEQEALADDTAVRLAEEQVGVLCVIETADDLFTPLVCDMRTGEALSLFDFVGGEDALAALTALAQTALTADTPYRPTSAGLVLLTADGTISLPWNMSPVLADCIVRWRMNEAPLCAPAGSVQVS